MRRFCTNCYREFTQGDFVREQSRGMEAERLAYGLEGVQFLYYHCPDCGLDDVFVDLLPLDGEDAEKFRERHKALEEAVRLIHADKVEVVLVNRVPAAY